PGQPADPPLAGRGGEREAKQEIRVARHRVAEEVHAHAEAEREHVPRLRPERGGLDPEVVRSRRAREQGRPRRPRDRGAAGAGGSGSIDATFTEARRAASSSDARRLTRGALPRQRSAAVSRERSVPSSAATAFAAPASRSAASARAAARPAAPSAGKTTTSAR